MAEKEHVGFYKYSEHDFVIDIDDEKRRKKYHTGYKKIDLCAMPEAGKITLIPAFTDHGKSVFLRNMLVNMWAGYPDTEFMYYTFEDNCYEVWAHICRLRYDMKYENDKDPNYKEAAEQFEKHITNNDEIGAIARGIQADMSKRVFIYDRNVSVNDIEKHIDDILQVNPRIGVVFIDYLQDVEPEEYSGQHHADLERMMIYMHNTAKKTGAAFIVAAQYRPDISTYRKVNKWDITGITKVFGSSSLYKKARLFYSLFNRTRFEHVFKHKTDPRLFDEIEIDILKQKKQNYGDYLTFDLCRKSGRITESDRQVDYSLDDKKNDEENVF